MKKGTYKLFSDNETLNNEYHVNASLSEMIGIYSTTNKKGEQARARFKLLSHQGNVKTYRLINTDYTFSITMP